MRASGDVLVAVLHNFLPTFVCYNQLACMELLPSVAVWSGGSLVCQTIFGRPCTHSLARETRVAVRGAVTARKRKKESYHCILIIL